VKDNDGASQHHSLRRKNETPQNKEQRDDFYVNPALVQTAQVKLIKLIKEAATRLKVLSEVSLPASIIALGR
jgi:hypothetical protein